MEHTPENHQQKTAHEIFTSTMTLHRLEYTCVDIQVDRHKCRHKCKHNCKHNYKHNCKHKRKLKRIHTTRANEPSTKDSLRNFESIYINYSDFVKNGIFM